MGTKRNFYSSCCGCDSDEEQEGTTEVFIPTSKLNSKFNSASDNDDGAETSVQVFISPKLFHPPPKIVRPPFPHVSSNVKRFKSESKLNSYFAYLNINNEEDNDNNDDGCKGKAKIENGNVKITANPEQRKPEPEFSSHAYTTTCTNMNMNCSFKSNRRKLKRTTANKEIINSVTVTSISNNSTDNTANRQNKKRGFEEMGSSLDYLKSGSSVTLPNFPAAMTPSSNKRQKCFPEPETPKEADVPPAPRRRLWSISVIKCEQTLANIEVTLT